MADLKSQFRALRGLLTQLVVVLPLTLYTLVKAVLCSVLFLLSGGLLFPWKSSAKHGIDIKRDQPDSSSSSSSSLPSTPEKFKFKAERFSRHIPPTQSRRSLTKLLKSSHFAEKESWWEDMREDIVFIPSQSIDRVELAGIKASHLYEERQLCMLFRLAEPNIRLVYVTSMPIDPAIIKYYFNLVKQARLFTVASAKSRLLLLSCNDPKLSPLSAKLLRRPQLIKKIKDFIDPSFSYLIPFVSSNLERELALTLKIPLTGTDPSLNYWGTKAGSREVFALAGVPRAPGTGLVYSLPELAEEILKLYLNEGKPMQIVIKLNIGFSGKGNAILPSSKISPEETEARVCELLETELQYSADIVWANFLKQLELHGALAEVWLDKFVSSPSVQASISVSGNLEILSTHEQMLDGSTYLGCVFPASEMYRKVLIDYTSKIGHILATKGCLERFSVDFVVTEHDKEIKVFCIEINIRWGGTSHPFITAKYLTRGTIDQEIRLIGADGIEKFYVSSDNVQNENFIGLNPDDFIDLTLTDARLQFNPETYTGVVLHLLSSIPRYGKFGLMTIANSRVEAFQMHQDTIQRLEELAGCISEGKIFKELDLSVATPSNSSSSVYSL